MARIAAIRKVLSPISENIIVAKERKIIAVESPETSLLVDIVLRCPEARPGSVH